MGVDGWGVGEVHSTRSLRSMQVIPSSPQYFSLIDSVSVRDSTVLIQSSVVHSTSIAIHHADRSECLVTAHESL